MKRSVLFLALLATGACSFQMKAQSAGSGTSTGNASSPEPSEKLESQGSGKAHTFSASFHEQGSVNGHIDWQGRSGRLCRATTPFKFVGTAQLAGAAKLTPSGVATTGSARASGTSSGGASKDGDCSAPRTPVPATKPAEPVKNDKPEPAKPKPQSGSDKKPADPEPTKPQSGSDKKPADPKPVKEPPKTPTGPTPSELEKPIEPPKEPSDNVFGYDKPVLGCFEGQVFPLTPDTQKLPRDYGKLSAVSVVYACEWDIAPRQWQQGFPGIADRFEWFAIRYAGAFRIATAGEYGFRISSDDGAKLVIDGRVVIDNDGQHPPHEARGKVQLSAADHQMVLEYFQGPRYEINLQLWVTPPGKSEELFTVR
jgi:hypothetical protein